MLNFQHKVDVVYQYDLVANYFQYVQTHHLYRFHLIHRDQLHLMIHFRYDRVDRMKGLLLHRHINLHHR